MMSRIVLARPPEASVLSLLGWEDLGPFSESFRIMKLDQEPPDTLLIVDLRKFVDAENFNQSIGEQDG